MMLRGHLREFDFKSGGFELWPYQWVGVMV